MKVNFILPKPPEIKSLLRKKPTVASPDRNQSSETLPIYSAQTSPINVNQWSKADLLFQTYANSIEKNKPISVFKLLESKDVTPDTALSFLTKVTSNVDTSFQFIEELIKDKKGNFAPQKSNQNVKKLIQHLGGKENFEKWYFGNDGYVKAFSGYARDYYKNAKSIQELYDLSPCWGAWAVRIKFIESKKETSESYKKEFIINERAQMRYTDGFTIGELPIEFQDKETYRQLIDDLRSCGINQSEIEECAKHYGFNSAKLLSVGASAKLNVVLNDKYVIKIQGTKDTSVNADYNNDIIDMTPDSIYLNSMIDYYTNKYSKNSMAQMYFYDNLSASAIYEYVKGKSLRFKTDEEALNVRNEYCDSLFKNVENIGISYTDYNGSNFIQTKDGIKCIDSGHAVFCDLLKPQATGLQISLPSRTGFNTLELQGRLYEVLN